MLAFEKTRLVRHPVVVGEPSKVGGGRGPESSSGDARARRVIQVALTHEIAVRTMAGVVRVPPDSARIRTTERERERNGGRN